MENSYIIADISIQNNKQGPKNRPKGRPSNFLSKPNYLKDGAKWEYPVNTFSRLHGACWAFQGVRRKLIEKYR